jgi:uncharacterized protein YqjF (DUF2071 family)
MADSAGWDDPKAVAHRPWPMPRTPWVMAQRWSQLLFLHWPVDPGALRPLVPPALTLDVRDGAAWVSVTSFLLSGLRPRALPAVPWLSRFPELNVRTYVTDGRKPGVYFFSLDAGRWLAVVGARTLYRLPYFRAAMRVRVAGDGTVRFDSRRIGGAAPAEFAAAYRPAGPVTRSGPGSLEHWLTERYCLYAVDPARRVYRAEIHHRPWPLQPVEVRIGRNTMGRAAGIELPDRAPHAAFSGRLDVRVWWPVEVRGGARA